MSRLPIPAAVLDQHAIALGKTGSGKSSKVRVLVEHLLDQNKPVCILDPKGDWWGLKSSADGKRAGYPVVIFGGQHADVPVQPMTAGAELADLIFTGNRSCIIDMKQWRPSERTKFFIDFAETAFKVTKGHRHLVISEVHNFAFKGKVLSPQAGDMLYWANRLASEGRGLGLNLLFDSQRPQKVHNDILDSCETLIACRTIHKSGREAIKDWIDGAADPEQGKEVLRELASMTRPEAWVWSPEISFGPKRLTFPMFTTYDSFKPQSVSVKKLKGWAEVDLQEVSAKLTKTVADAQANDPGALKKRVRELEMLLAKAPAAKSTVAQDSPATKAELRTALSTIKNLRHLIGELMKFVVKINAEGFGKDAGVDPAELKQAIDAAVTRAMAIMGTAAAGRERALKQLQSDAGRLIRAAKKLMTDEPVDVTVNVQHQAPYAVSARHPITPREPGPSLGKTAAPVQRPAPRSGEVDASIGKSGGKYRIMVTLAQHGRMNEKRLALLAGLSSKGGTWSTYLSALRTAGYIEGTGELAATDTGLSALGSYDPAPTGDALIQYWRDRIGGGGRLAIFNALVDAYPDAIDQESLAQSVNLSSAGGTWSTYLSSLRTMELITGKKELRAAEELFS